MVFMSNISRVIEHQGLPLGCEQAFAHNLSILANPKPFFLEKLGSGSI